MFSSGSIGDGARRSESFRAITSRLCTLGSSYLAKVAEHPNAERARSLLHGDALRSAPLACIDERPLAIRAGRFQLGANGDEPLTKLAPPNGGGLALSALHDA